ncbi:MAG: CAP domain-containing protein [archaeon]|nr:CAP domain-containing protein [archaeon]
MNKFVLVALIAVISCAIDTDDYNMKEIARHNEYRRKHVDTPDLKLNGTLVTRAQQYADSLCAKNPASQSNLNWGHSDCRLNGTVLGENLYGSWGRDPVGGAAADDWCKFIIINSFLDAEGADYDYEKGTGINGAVTGHFTQVVWSETTSAGFGICKAENGWWIIVGNY